MRTAKTILAALAVAAMTATPQLAMAKEATVTIADLDLTTQEGQAEMAKRVRAAAYKVCLYRDDGMVATPEQQNNCARAALEKSEGQMATAVNNARLGG